MLKRVFWWGFAICWIIVIFYFSSQPAEISRDQSQVIVERVEGAVVSIEYSLDIDILSRYNLHRIVRKNAHVFNYFILTLVIVFALDYSGVKGRKKYFYSWLVGTIIAVMDEIYQSFIPGRSGEIRDVFIDNIGILLGLVFHIAIRKIRKSIG